MDLARLTYMANQIARNFAIQGDDAAIAATCQHMQLFWEPRMKAAILSGDRAGLERLRRRPVHCGRWTSLLRTVKTAEPTPNFEQVKSYKY